MFNYFAVLYSAEPEQERQMFHHQLKSPKHVLIFFKKQNTREIHFSFSVSLLQSYSFLLGLFCLFLCYFLLSQATGLDLASPSILPCFDLFHIIPKYLNSLHNINSFRSVLVCSVGVLLRLFKECLFQITWLIICVFHTFCSVKYKYTQFMCT